jgi:hypothetical protein
VEVLQQGEVRRAKVAGVFPAATSACSMACREAPVEYRVWIWMPVTSTPFGPDYLRVAGDAVPWPERPAV